MPCAHGFCVPPFFTAGYSWWSACSSRTGRCHAGTTRSTATAGALTASTRTMRRPSPGAARTRRTETPSSWLCFHSVALPLPPIYPKTPAACHPTCAVAPQVSQTLRLRAPHARHRHVHHHVQRDRGGRGGRPPPRRCRPHCVRRRAGAPPAAQWALVSAVAGWGDAAVYETSGNNAASLSLSLSLLTHRQTDTQARHWVLLCRYLKPAHLP